jgi:hypothetical protein
MAEPSPRGETLGMQLADYLDEHRAALDRAIDRFATIGAAATSIWVPQRFEPILGGASYRGIALRGMLADNARPTVMAESG